MNAPHGAATTPGARPEEVASREPPPSEAPWMRLNARMIWADALRVLLSLAPAGVALLVFRVDADAGVLWPAVGIAGWGLGVAVADVLRWVTTRYRLTETHLERRTGLFFRTFRSIQRDRIRSVDADARLLQRIAGLRRVRVGAGQVNTAMESALHLNAVARADAEELQRRLMGGRARHQPVPTAATPPVDGADGGAPNATGQAVPADTAGPAPAEAGTSASDPAETPGTRVFSGLRWWWVWYNVFNLWALFMAAGLFWGAWVTLGMFGLDVTGWLGGLADWESLGTLPTVALAVAAAWTLGAVGMAANFFSEHWNFQLSRVPGENGTVLRTSQGLFRTREINRDDHRLRGMTISEPLLWRWMRMVDTMVITTGLSMWSGSSTIVPRGPRSISRQVVRAVLETDTSPLEAPLRRHPRAALRRRVVWASLVTGAVTALLGWLTATTALPVTVVAVTGPVLLVLALVLAWVGYRALGHTLTDEYVVVRAGAVSRKTTALQRRAVSGVRVRQSLLQRRLGLATVSVSTAAGWLGYEAVDVAAGESAALADRALPLGLAPFLITDPGGDGPPPGGHAPDTGESADGPAGAAALPAAAVPPPPHGGSAPPAG